MISFQKPPPLAPLTNRDLPRAPNLPSLRREIRRPFLHEIPSFNPKIIPALTAIEAGRMPRAAQRRRKPILHDQRLAPETPRRRALRVAPHTPRVPVFFDKRGCLGERVAAFGAEEVAGVPVGAAGDDDFAFDRRLAVFAAGAEELVVVDVAVEAL